MSVTDQRLIFSHVRLNNPHFLCRGYSATLTSLVPGPVDVRAMKVRIIYGISSNYFIFLSVLTIIASLGPRRLGTRGACNQSGPQADSNYVCMHLLIVIASLGTCSAGPGPC